MTRFARAKGSKSSNERLPEGSTPWGVMKQQLQEKQKSSNKLLSNREETSYSDKKDDEKTEWAEFEKPRKGKGLVKEKKKKDYLHKQSHRNDKIEKKSSKNKKLKMFTEETIKNGALDDNARQEKQNSSIKSLSCREEKKKKASKSHQNDKIEKKSSKNKKLQMFTEETIKNGALDDNARQEKQNLSIKSLSGREEKNKKASKSHQNDKIVKKSSKNKKLQMFTEETIKNGAMDIDKMPSSYLKDNNTRRRKISRESKQKLGKKLRGEPYKRRKPKTSETLFINGKEIDVVQFGGFPVKKEDADRLLELHRNMIQKGLPKNEVDAAIKLERRRAEKAFARERKTVCFYCRKSGHLLSQCPELGNSNDSGTGICYKCGSTEHTYFNCKVVRGEDYRYAECFICKEQGHISRQCPDNPRGLYPKGGACNVCGNVTHLKKDCPDLIAQKEEGTITLETLNNDSIEVLDEDMKKNKVVLKHKKISKKIVKF